MINFSNWTLDTVRELGSSFSWLENRRADWTPIVASTIVKIIEGYSVVIVTDDKTKWIQDYLISSINCNEGSKPFLPFYKLSSLTSNSIFTKESRELVDDLLSISFNDKFAYFYIGNSNHINASIAKKRYNSLLWMSNEKLQNSFYLDSDDELLDIKLVQMSILFSKSIEVSLFGDVEL